MPGVKPARAAALRKLFGCDLEQAPQGGQVGGTERYAQGLGQDIGHVGEGLGVILDELHELHAEGHAVL